MVGCVYSLPDEWENEKKDTVYRWYVFISAVLGLITGLLIGLSTFYFTSNEF